MKYRISKGFDHYNFIPLFCVVGVDNDYVGEWSKDIKPVIKERDDLEESHKLTKVDTYIKDNLIKIINLACVTNLNHCKAVIVQTICMTHKKEVLEVKEQIYTNSILEKYILRFLSELPCFKDDEAPKLASVCNTLTSESLVLIKSVNASLNSNCEGV